MLLRRIGNKAKLVPLIQEYFPPHSLFIEPFFGAGGMFFNKSPAQFNYLNDIDNDVYNLYMQVQFNYDNLKNAIENLIYHKSLFKWFRANDMTNDLWRAIKFLYLSNFSYLGISDMICFKKDNSKIVLLNDLKLTYEFLTKYNIQFNNCDFRVFLKEFNFRRELDKNSAFVYCDPPYLNTADNYSQRFILQDTIDLFDTMINSGIRFAISEFNSDTIVNLAQERKLNIFEIKERRTLNNRSTEILITNYDVNIKLF